MPDIIITPSIGKLEFVDDSIQVTRRHSFTLDQNDGLVLDAPLSAAAISAPLNVINVTVTSRHNIRVFPRLSTLPTLAPII